jgi:hypothetical protein
MCTLRTDSILVAKKKKQGYPIPATMNLKFSEIVELRVPGYLSYLPLWSSPILNILKSANQI